MEGKNARFHRMSEAEQRVAIAKDALEWLQAGALRACSGTYFDPVSVDGRRTLDCAEEYKQLRSLKLGKCEVCAIGALFAAKAVRFNAVTVGDAQDGGWHEKLLDHFSPGQLSLIESAFEGASFGVSFGEDEEEDRYTQAYRELGGAESCSKRIGEAVHFGKRYRSDRARLCAILNNIIANEGEFRPV